MVTSAKSAVPTVADQAAAMQLGQCAKNLATCLAELRTATQKVSIYSTVSDGRIDLTNATDMCIYCELLFDVRLHFVALYLYMCNNSKDESNLKEKRTLA